MSSIQVTAQKNKISDAPNSDGEDNYRFSSEREINLHQLQFESIEICLWLNNEQLPISKPIKVVKKLNVGIQAMIKSQLSTEQGKFMEKQAAVREQVEKMLYESK